MTAAAAPVYLGYTQADLDRAYDQRAYAGNADQVIAWYREESARARREFQPRTAAYGPGADETLDIFSAADAAAPAPVHIHVHGGGWRNLTKDDESFLARSFVPAGAVLVVLNFSTIPKVRLPEMIAQARRATAWVHAHAAEFGGDPARIHVSGHSSGGHMAGVLATTDWAAHGLPGDVLKSALLMSGMYDLRPVMLSARSAYVKLSADEIAALSPILHLDQVRARLLLVYGDRETPEFQRQPRAFADAVRAAGRHADLLQLDGVNHFELLTQLNDPASQLSREALRLMGL